MLHLNLVTNLGAGTYSAKITPAMLAVHGPLGANEPMVIQLVVELLNGLDDVHDMLKARKLAQQAALAGPAGGAGGSGAGRNRLMMHNVPETPVTPATPALMREMLAAQPGG